MDDAKRTNAAMNNKTNKRWRRPSFFENWRFSEFILLGGIFSLGVLILTIHLATWGVETRREAKNLTSVECSILGRVIRSRTSDDGQTFYRPEVTLEYEFNEQKYVVATYEKATLDPNGAFVDSKEEALKKLESYPPKTKAQCWLRADRPTEAYLVKRPAIWGWIFLIVPTSLILFGGIWMIVRAREMIFSKEALANERRQTTLYPTVPSIPRRSASRGVVLARRLPTDVKSTFHFGASFFGAALWNLASWSVFVFVLTSAKTRLDYWLAGGFCLFFCGVGALFACRLWREYRVERVVGSIALEASMLPIVPGRRVKCCLFLKGRIEAKRLDVFIRCEEIARYLQGTNAICNRHEVFSRTIFTKYDVVVSKDAEEREVFTTLLPNGVAPSFVAEHNEISWKFTARAEFADGGTFTRDFAIVVIPSPTEVRDEEHL